MHYMKPIYFAHFQEYILWLKTHMYCKTGDCKIMNKEAKELGQNIKQVQQLILIIQSFYN